MTESLATRASRGHRTLCLPIAEEAYRRIVAVPAEFHRELDHCFRRMPELFPANFADGYQLKDDRTSAKRKVPIRRIITRDGAAYSVRPSFLMPYRVARSEDVEGPLFLRKFAVPYRALGIKGCPTRMALSQATQVGSRTGFRGNSDRSTHAVQ